MAIQSYFCSSPHLWVFAIAWLQPARGTRHGAHYCQGAFATRGGVACTCCSRAVAGAHVAGVCATRQRPEAT